MKRLFIFVSLLVVFFCVSQIAVFAAECKYVKDDKVKVNKDGYLMSYLWLDPTIENNMGSVPAQADDYFKDIPNKKGKKGEANLMPAENEKVKLDVDKKEHVWVRVNFHDMVETGEIRAEVGGNELDVGCWAGKDNEAQYLVSYLKWKSDKEITFTLGSDDASESYLNGEKVTNAPVDQDWAPANGGIGKAKVKGGQWNVLVVGIYESGGEWGVSVKIDPVPDEVDNTGKPFLAVEPKTKLSATWGAIKRGY